MFYSTRYFWKIVIILVLLALILPHLPEVFDSAKSFINFIMQKLSRLTNIIK